jgi:molybdate/tungstate transport system substrate-binding protein
MRDDRNAKQIFPEEILKTILKQGQLDAVAAHKHEAVARGLPYITLPHRLISQIQRLLTLIRIDHTL